ncbi:TPA: hypothetical protein ACH3X1_016003 [Trebouxia sp. C0004]
MADAFEIQRDRLLAEVDNVYDVLVREHNSGLVLCKFDDCTSEDDFVWERDNFVLRSKAYRHMLPSARECALWAPRKTNKRTSLSGGQKCGSPVQARSNRSSSSSA